MTMHSNERWLHRLKKELFGARLVKESGPLMLLPERCPDYTLQTEPKPDINVEIEALNKS